IAGAAAASLTAVTGLPLTLTNSNTYDGQTIIPNQRQIIITNGGALGSTVGRTVVNSGGELELNNLSGGITVAEPISISGNGSASNDGAITVFHGNNTWSGDVTLAAAARIATPGGNLTITGNIGGGGSLTKTGANTTLILS